MSKATQELGMIKIDSDYAKSIGFTSDKFLPYSYLWLTDDKEIMISLIESKEQGKGYFTGLLDALKSLSYTIKVPTPFARMKAILQKRGFIETSEITDMGDEVEVWILPAT